MAVLVMNNGRRDFKTEQFLEGNKTLNPIEQTMASTLVKPSYSFISTAEILQAFEAQGWTPANIHIAKTRVEARQGFQKHIVRLNHPDFTSIAGLSNNNASRPQLCLLNSHDGSAALRLFYGVLRIACLNGIIAGSVLKSFRVVHSGNVTGNLSTGIEYMTSNISELTKVVTALSQARFSLSAECELVHGLVDARLANVRNVVNVNYNSATRVLRAQDTGSDAYTVFNRIQESLVRGGIEYTYNKEIKDKATGQVIDIKQVTTKTRRLSSVSSQLALNQKAFDLAVKLAV